MGDQEAARPAVGQPNSLFAALTVAAAPQGVVAAEVQQVLQVQEEQEEETSQREEEAEIEGSARLARKHPLPKRERKAFLNAKKAARDTVNKAFGRLEASRAEATKNGGYLLPLLGQDVFKQAANLSLDAATAAAMVLANKTTAITATKAYLVTLDNEAKAAVRKFEEAGWTIIGTHARSITMAAALDKSRGGELYPPHTEDRLLKCYHDELVADTEAVCQRVDVSAAKEVQEKSEKRDQARKQKGTNEMRSTMTQAALQDGVKTDQLTSLAESVAKLIQSGNAKGGGKPKHPKTGKDKGKGPDKGKGKGKGPNKGKGKGKSGKAGSGKGKGKGNGKGKGRGKGKGDKGKSGRGF